jgi:hypothetical protein
VHFDPDAWNQLVGTYMRAARAELAGSESGMGAFGNDIASEAAAARLRQLG